jgi:WD40-like Beta Propeller Repeat
MIVRALGRIGVLASLALAAGTLAFASGGGSTPPANPAIAFVASSTNLSVMNADGARRTVVFASSAFLLTPCWSPSGGSICFAIQVAGGAGLAVIDVQVVNGTPVGSNFRMLASGSNTKAAWSADGSTIAFTNSLWPGIWSVPAAGGTPMQLYSGSTSIHWLAWSSDSSRIAFSCAAGLQGELRVLDTADGSDFLVCTLAGSINQVDWARTGNKIVFDAYAASGNGKYIYTVNGTAGATPQLVVPSGAHFPTWSPDDSKIGYTSGSQDNIVIRTLATGSVSSTGAKGRFANWRRY